MGLTPRGIEYPDPSTGMSILAITQTLANTTDAAIGAVAAQMPTIGEWQNFTPVWTASTTNPTLGNGTLVGRFTQIGNTVHYSITLTIGSTTTNGSGVYRFSPPVAPSQGTLSPAGNALLADASPVAYRPRTAYFDTPARIVMRDEAGANVTHNAPWTWATGDTIKINGTYEAAV